MIGTVDAFQGGFVTGVVLPCCATSALPLAAVSAIAGRRLFLVRLVGLIVLSPSSVDLSRLANLAFAASLATYPAEDLSLPGFGGAEDFAGRARGFGLI